MTQGNDVSGQEMIELRRTRIPELDLEREGNEWMTYLSRSLSGKVGDGGLSGNATIGAVSQYRLTFSGGALQTQLWLAQDEGDVVCTVAGPANVPSSEQQVTPWLEVIEEATAKYRDDLPVFPWVALIGPHLECARQQSDALKTEITVGDLKLLQATTYMHEDFPIVQPPTVRGYCRAGSWPIEVEGTSPGLEPWDVSAKAMGPLRRLCHLLSLAWDSCWVIREAPNQITKGRPKTPTKTHLTSDRHGQKKIPAWEELNVPTWVVTAWPALEQSADLQNALAVYHEGLLLRENHPSLAVVAFISAIETVGTKHVKVRRCKECKQIKDSSKRFRETLARAVGPVRVKAVEEMYKKRSKTAHAGVLHGHEVHSQSWSLFTVDPAESFSWLELGELQRATRDVLLNEFGVPVEQTHSAMSDGREKPPSLKAFATIAPHSVSND